MARREPPSVDLVAQVCRHLGPKVLGPGMVDAPRPILKRHAIMLSTPLTCRNR
jgi:hypothetical protein